MAAQDCLDACGKSGNILRVLHDGQPFAVLVGLDSFQTFEHFIPRDAEAAFRSVEVGEKSAPHRVRVKNRAGPADAGHSKMKQRLCRGFAGTAKDIAVSINLQEVLRVESCLVEPRRRYKQTQRLAPQNGAEVAARAERPSTGIEGPPRLSKSVGEPPGGSAWWLAAIAREKRHADKDRGDHEMRQGNTDNRKKLPLTPMSRLPQPCQSQSIASRVVQHEKPSASPHFENRQAQNRL